MRVSVGIYQFQVTMTIKVIFFLFYQKLYGSYSTKILNLIISNLLYGLCNKLKLL